MLSGRDREPLPGAAAGMADPHLPGGCRIGDVPAPAPVSYQGRPVRGMPTFPCAAFPGPVRDVTECEYPHPCDKDNHNSV